MTTELQTTIQAAQDRLQAALERLEYACSLDSDDSPTAYWLAKREWRSAYAALQHAAKSCNHGHGNDR